MAGRRRLGVDHGFAGEADAADAPGLRDYGLVKQLALLVCLVHKAQMRARDIAEIVRQLLQEG